MSRFFTVYMRAQEVNWLCLSQSVNLFNIRRQQIAPACLIPGADEIFK